MVFLYFLFIYILTALFGYTFWIDVKLPMVLKLISLISVLYIAYNLIEIFVSFIFYIFSKPRILKEGKLEELKGLIVSFRPIFANTDEEMENLLKSMEKDIENNLKDFPDRLKFIVIDNTRNESVKEYTKRRIRELQDKYSDKTVFYFHRNKECDFFKKLGILEDACLFLYKGWTRPGHYISEKWQIVAKGTRDKNKPLWDIILGDISALGIKASVEDVLSGREVDIDEEKRVKVIFVSDADNVWSEGEIKKMVLKIVNPDNRKYVIFQPKIKVNSPYKNIYTKVSVIYRNITHFVPTLRWRLFNFSPFYGKGAMRVDDYIEKVILSEALNPAKAASHDFQETLFAMSALVEDVIVLEDIFSNKVSEIKRVAQWRWGDMETVRQFIFKKWETGRKKHLFVLLRGLIEPIVIDILILIFSISVLTNSLYFNSGIILYIFSGLILFPFVFGVFVSRVNIFESILSFLVLLFLKVLDFIYMPQAILRNYIRQLKGEPYKWKTGAMGEIETRGMNLFKVYKALKNSSLAGILFLGFAYFNRIFLILGVIFILSPFFVWITCRESKKEEST